MAFKLSFSLMVSRTQDYLVFLFTLRKKNSWSPYTLWSLLALYQLLPFLWTDVNAVLRFILPKSHHIPKEKLGNQN